MMEEKIAHIHFDRDAFMANQQVIWQLMYKGVSTSYIIYMVVTGVVLIAGTILTIQYGFPITLFVGIGMVITILLRFRHVYTVKRNFFRRADAVARKHERDLPDYSYTLNNEGLTYRDRERALMLTWQLFEPMLIRKEALILKLKEEDKIHAVISQQETGKDNYRDIFNILVDKIGVADEVL